MLYWEHQRLIRPFVYQFEDFTRFLEVYKMPTRSPQAAQGPPTKAKVMVFTAGVLQNKAPQGFYLYSAIYCDQEKPIDVSVGSLKH